MPKKKKTVKKILVANDEVTNLSFSGGDPLNSSRSKNSKTNAAEIEVEQSMEDSTLQFEESKREDDVNGYNDLNESQGNLSSSQGGGSTARDGGEESKNENSSEKMILAELQSQIENETEKISPSKLKTIEDEEEEKERQRRDILEEHARRLEEERQYLEERLEKYRSSYAGLTQKVQSQKTFSQQDFQSLEGLLTESEAVAVPTLDDEPHSGFEKELD